MVRKGPLVGGFTILLIIEFGLGNLPLAYADTPGGEMPVGPTFIEQTPSVKSSATSPAKTDSDWVSSTGALQHSIPLKVPPGRNGMAPSLALSYTSAAADQPSAFGAGWSLPMSSIRRSVRHGTPRIVSKPSYHYNDNFDDPSDNVPRFERDGVEMVVDRTSPSDGRGLVFRDHIDRTFAKSLYHASTPSSWTVLDKNGTKHYYGADPDDSSVPTAVVQDELGITQWLLVRSVDSFGNTIDYQYVQAPRSDLTKPQLAPLPVSIQYGKNLNTQSPHYARVDFNYTTTPLQQLDYAHGHVYLDRVISTVAVSLTVSQTQLVRAYAFNVVPSASSFRYLLMSMQEQAPGLAAPKVQFTYTTQPPGQQFAGSPVSNILDPAVFHLYSQFSGVKGIIDWGALLSPAAPWPMGWLNDNRLSPAQVVTSPQGVPFAFRFEDLNGDGALDILYHPDYAAGEGVAAPWMSFIQDAFQHWTTIDAKYRLGDPLFFLRGASEFVDVDQDGAADRILFPPGYSTGLGGSSNEPNPVTSQLCDWWFQHAGGYTDPSPELFPAALIALYLVDTTIASHGIRSSDWQQAVRAVLRSIMPGIDSFHLPLLQIGGIPGGLGYCYKTNTALNPIQSNFLPDVDPTQYWLGGDSPDQGAPIVVQHGMLEDDAGAAASKPVVSSLKHYDRIGRPYFTITGQTLGGAAHVEGLRVEHSAFTPVIDLDQDGIPDVVSIKDWDINGIQAYGVGFWRLRNLSAVHEQDDAAVTETQFTSSLKKIYFVPAPPGNPFGPPTPTVCFFTEPPLQLIAEKLPAARRTAAIARAKQRLASAKRQSSRPAVAEEKLKGLAFGVFRERIVLESLELLKRYFPPQKQPDVKAALQELLAIDSILGRLMGSWFEPGGYLNQRLLNVVDWISTFLDVNGDGLPDLVVAKGATCFDPSQTFLNNTDHQIGFDVYLNRGDRFEPTPDAGTPFAGGPFNMVRNWNMAPLLGQNSLIDRDHFPFSSLAFGDVDGDGIMDATLSALISSEQTDFNSWTPAWTLDLDACLEDDVASPKLQRAVVRCAWRGTGVGWSPARDLASQIPNDGATYSASVYWKPQGFPFGSFDERLAVGDRLRFADFDGDGINDIISVRMATPQSEPPRIYHNNHIKPDLLRTLDNGIGAVTTISYRAAQRQELDGGTLQDPPNRPRMPKIPWVVDTISTDSQADKSDTAAIELSTFSYSEARYDFHEREFLGFKKVTETRPVTEAAGGSKESLVLERTFYQGEQTVLDSNKNVLAADPLKGLLGAELRHSTNDGKNSSSLTTFTYEVVSGGGAIYRVRPTGSSETTCTGVGCWLPNKSSRSVVQVDRAFGRYDDYDNATTTDITASRLVNDSIGNRPSIKIHFDRSYDNKTGPWIIGLKTSEKRTDATSGLLQAWDESAYYDTGAIKQTTRHRQHVETACNDRVPAFHENFVYYADGLVEDVTDDNDQIVGGAQPKRHFDYDPQLHVFVAATTDYYLRRGNQSTLTTKTTFDARFGTLSTRTDPNGRTEAWKYDALGRVTDEYDSDNNLVRHADYNLSVRPQTRTVTEYPRASQPNIVRTEYLDGQDRLREEIVATKSGGVVSHWHDFDSLGHISEEVLPFETSAVRFAARTSLGSAAMVSRIHYDGSGHLIEVDLPDGRKKQTTYGDASRTDIDAIGTPHDQYFDALGRVIAVDEYYRPANSQGVFKLQHTSFTRDVDGRITQLVDSEGNVRNFVYDESGNVVRAEAPHAANARAIDAYSSCFDGKGREVETFTPEGRHVHESRDELGRLTVRQYESPNPKVPGGKDQFFYDDPATSNGLGRLTSESNAIASETLAYDSRGNVVQRSYTTTLGKAASPWKDGTFTSTAAYDQLDRPIAQSLPIDPQQINATTKLAYSYDERGLPSRLSVDGKAWLGIDDYAPQSAPRHVSYPANGLAETRVYEPGTQRLSSTFLYNPKQQPIQSYSFAYDSDDNPISISRFIGSGLSGVGPVINKALGFDSLNRLETANFDGVNSSKSWTYHYSPAGNITQKDGLNYIYDGRDPQAITGRSANSSITSSKSAEEQYGYDRDGNVVAATRSQVRDIDTWDADGRLVTVANAATNRTFRFNYDANGDRLSKQLVCTTTSGCTPWTDIYVGALELRGSESSSVAVPAYYNLDLGAVHAQLALRHDASGKLARDAQADRFFYKDYLNSTALVAAPDGSLVSSVGDAGRLEYAPYGEPLITESGAGRIKQRFTSKETDETQFAFYGSRYYDSALGRWLSRDPASISRVFPGSIVKNNLFAFSGNAPAVFIDPSGEDFLDSIRNGALIIIGGIGAAATDISVGLIKYEPKTDPERYGASVTHVAMLRVGATETTLGAGMTGGGLAAAPETGGVSLITAGEGLLVTGHGALVIKTAAQELISLSKAQGGIGPVLKGQAGEAKSEQEAIDVGEKVRGRQVTFELPSGKRTRPDLVTDTPASELKVREAKNGPSARLTPGQTELKKTIDKGGPLIPRGANAQKAGLKPGEPVTIKHFEEDRY
jgi:RHS repeat-associated protein